MEFAEPAEVIVVPRPKSLCTHSIDRQPEKHESAPQSPREIGERRSYLLISLEKVAAR
jgi:hypothetical protein